MISCSPGLGYLGYSIFPKDENIEIQSKTTNALLTTVGALTRL